MKVCTNSVEGPVGWLSHNERYKTCNGWHSGMMVPISSIIGILILYTYVVRMYYVGQRILSGSFHT